MAKNVKEETKQITAKELKRVVNDALRQKEQASEYTGRHGQIVKQAVESYGLHRKAFNQCVAAEKMDLINRQDFMAATIDYWVKMGFFAGDDMFERMGETLNAALESLKSSNVTSITPADKKMNEALAE